MPRPRRDPPRSLSPDWPDVECAEPDAEVMRRLALNLREAIGDRSLREVGRACNLHHSVVVKVLEGTAWVEALSVARLEVGLGVRLWPDLDM